MTLAADLCALMACAGLAAVLAGVVAVCRFAALPSVAPHARPPFTILRPLCGAEHGLDEALDSLAAQTYPDFQIVLGIKDAADAAHDAARRFAARHSGRDITIVIDATLHGTNRKISNLINMLPAAKHAMLVFSDSDLHVAPDYLDHLAAALEVPGVGLATTLCVSRLECHSIDRAPRSEPNTRNRAHEVSSDPLRLEQAPVRPTLAGRLASLHMRHCFLPGALLGHWAGRQDCLGNTMALRRSTLCRVGGLAVLADQLADDNVLGQLVGTLGLRIAIARTVTAATVADTTVASLWHHELRWGRTIRSMFPLAFAGSAANFPLFWAALACLANPGHPAFLTLLAAAVTVRAGAVYKIDAVLAARFKVPPQIGLMPLLIARDTLSVLIVAASFLGRSVTWRGHVMQADGYREPVLKPGIARPMVP